MTTPSRIPTPRRLRAAGPQRQRGAASLLRLSQGSAPRLPSGGMLADWVSRAAEVLMPGDAAFVAAVPGSGPDAMITRLWPRVAAR